MEFLKDMPDKAFELAIVDPPYEIADNPSRHGGTGAGKLKNRILNQSAHKFKSWDKIPDKNYFVDLFRVSKNQIIWGGNYFPLPPTRGIAVWDKCQPWENFSQIELAWTSFYKPAKLFRFDNRTGDKIHPTQKPIELYEWLLKNYAKPGDKILDTHLGSGSSAIACYNLDFDFTGIELDEDYYNGSVKRLEKHKKQIRMFG
ncbi:MAG: DNA methyltransferase [Janthinobacterium sp.]|jgi:site-specific DNA-methyltransferase (adenine-specific)